MNISLPKKYAQKEATLSSTAQLFASTQTQAPYLHVPVNGMQVDVQSQLCSNTSVYAPSNRLLNDVDDVDMESVVNGGGIDQNDYFDFDFNFNELYDDQSEFLDTENYEQFQGSDYCQGQVRTTIPTGYNSTLDPKIEQSNLFLTTEIIPVKPRKIVATQNDFQQKFKTEICRNWEMSKCPFGTECTFAHGEHELQVKNHIPTNYRTKRCNNFYQNLYCPYGNRCQFYHAEKPQSMQPEKKQSYEKNLEEVKHQISTMNQEIRNESLYLNFPQSQQLEQQASERILKQFLMRVSGQIQNQKLKVFNNISLTKNAMRNGEETSPYFSDSKHALDTTANQINSGFNSARKSNLGINSNRNSKKQYRQNHSQSTNSLNYQHTSGSKSKNPKQQKMQSISTSQFQFKSNQKPKVQQSPGGHHKPSSFFNGQGTNYSQNQSNSSNYKYHSPQRQEFNYQVPVPQLPQIQQFFPDLGYKKRMGYLNEIKEIINDHEQITGRGGRERTNSDNFADNVIQQAQNEIKAELNKPSNQQVTSFTENMVYTHPQTSSNTANRKGSN